MAVTIKDVAALAGVSTSTVSRVCNNNPAISRETQERVRKAMAELGYEGNLSCEAQAPQPIKMIGIVLPPSDRDAYENNFFLKAIRGISQVCNQRQAASTVITGKDHDELLHSVKTLHLSGRIDGFILLYSRKNDAVIDYLCEQGALYVIVGKPQEMAGQTLCIDNDNLLASREATDYLYNLGHRRIGYLGSTRDFLFAADRYAGHQLSLLLHGLPVQPDYYVEMDQVNSDDESLRKLLAREDRPTAFVVSEDMLALALERACLKMGLSIPQDISIIAFNNSLYSQLASPQLTAVDINSYQLGQEAAAQVINYLDNPNLRTTKIVVPHQIVERDSCRSLDPAAR
ncbi:MAG: LacI family DNA-binding transcriptional regulator [Oscillospiraceae bacterium]|nr:LacI family DNA-binding transcriptional regulator [Oscillospiraceae bacterium]